MIKQHEQLLADCIEMVETAQVQHSGGEVWFDETEQLFHLQVMEDDGIRPLLEIHEKCGECLKAALSKAIHNIAHNRTGRFVIPKGKVTEFI